MKKTVGLLIFGLLGSLLIAGTVRAESTKYNITVTANTGGTVSPSGSSVQVEVGKTMKFTFKSWTGYKVQSVKVDNTEVGAVTSYTFSSVTGNHTLDVAFVSKDVIPENTKTCLKALITARETAIEEQKTTYNTGLATALTTRKNGLNAAWESGKWSEVKGKILTTYNTYIATVAGLKKTRDNAIKNIWSAYHKIRKAPLNKDDSYSFTYANGSFGTLKGGCGNNLNDNFMGVDVKY